MASQPQPIIYNQPGWYVENVYQTVNNYILPAERQPLWVDVPSLTAHFLGRETIVADLSARLTAGGSIALSADGKPGVGKTTLAVALAHHREVLAHFSDGVLWAGLGPQPDLPSRLARWADALGIDVSDRPTVEARAQAVADAIGHRKLLLVIDDAWQLEAAETLRVGGPNCAHLLTSRDQRLALQFAGRSERVEELTPTDALELLRRLAPKAVAVDEAKAAGLLAAVGYLPLAVELLGGYLAAGASARFADASRSALADLTDPARRLALASKRLGAPPEPVEGQPQKVSLEATIGLSIDGLAEDSPQAVAAFYSLGAFAPKPASFDRIAAQAVAECDADTLALLIDRNLLEQDEADESLALHQTLADVARSHTPEGAVIRHREHFLARVKSDPENWQAIEAVYPQLQYAWQQTPSAHQATVTFVDALEPYQTRRGFWTDRLDWLSIALAAAKRNGDANGRALILTYYGFVYDVLEEKTKALNYYEDALHWRRLIGDRNGEALILGNIGGIFYQLGEKSTALGYYEDALYLQRLIGDRNGQATTLNNIGALYDAVGEMANALKYFVEALYLKRLVGDRSGEAVALNSIGGVYNALGEKAKAFEYFMEALPLRRLVGDLSGEATTLNNIGGIYVGFGQEGDALVYYETALSLCLQVGNRREEAITLNNIGGVYDDSGERNKALGFYEKSLNLFRQVRDYRGEATTLNNIGQVYSALGDKGKALEHYEEALHLELLNEDPFGESVTRFNMAMVFKSLDRLAEAEDQMEIVVQIDEAVGHPDLASDRQELERVRMLRSSQ